MLVVCNLKPAPLRGEMSAGMVMCASDADKTTVQLLRLPEGAKVHADPLPRGYPRGPSSYLFAQQLLGILAGGSTARVNEGNRFLGVSTLPPKVSQSVRDNSVISPLIKSHGLCLVVRTSPTITSLATPAECQPKAFGSGRSATEIIASRMRADVLPTSPLIRISRCFATL